MYSPSPTRRTGIWSSGGPGHPLCHSALIAVCSFSSWTMLTSIAHSGAVDWVNNIHPAALFVMIMVCDVAVIGPLCIAGDEEHMDLSDSTAFFTSALIGCSISAACSFWIPQCRNELCRHAWSLSGVYIGVAVELTMRPFTRLFQHISSTHRGRYSTEEPYLPVPRDEHTGFVIHEDPHQSGTDSLSGYENDSDKENDETAAQGYENDSYLEDLSGYEKESDTESDETAVQGYENDFDKESDETAAPVARPPLARRRITPYIAVILLSTIFGVGSVSRKS